MSTDVVHGPAPQFRVPLASGAPYRVTIEGHYSKENNWTAAGVTSFEWHSQRPEKRRPELLGLRSAFIDWFLLKWVEHGGTFDEGVAQLAHYPFENHRQRAQGKAQ
jgi:hypothetical protein